MHCDNAYSNYHKYILICHVTLSSWLAKQEDRVRFPASQLEFSEIGYLLPLSRDMAERSLNRRYSSKQRTNQVILVRWNNILKTVFLVQKLQQSVINLFLQEFLHQACSHSASLLLRLYSTLKCFVYSILIQYSSLILHLTNGDLYIIVSKFAMTKRPNGIHF